MKKGEEDIVIEDEAEVTPSLGGDKKLREKLKIAEAKAKEYLDGWQRAQADFVNIRRRDEEAKSEFIRFAKVSLIQELIPVLDSFNIALSQGHKDLEPLYGQFMAVLKSSGLEEIEPLKEIFDPQEHEAVATIPTEKENDDHKILEVLQKGYRLGGKVLRPAQVKVGAFTNANKN